MKGFDVFIFLCIGVFLLLLWSVPKLSDQNEKLRNERDIAKAALDDSTSEFNKSKDELEKDKAAFQTMVAEKTQGFPWLAKAYADYLWMKDNDKAYALELKDRPAKKAADELREVARAKRETVERCKVAEYTIAYFEALFPWLADLKEIDEESLISAQQASVDFESIEDPARRWLTDGEYKNLPAAEKYQLALDRYLAKRKKTNWELGRDYERYIGYLYESSGYDVKYRGIIDGFEDLGRDLICKKDCQVIIVQCKYWSSHKLIHEKHINQLFGTAVMYALQNGLLSKDAAAFSIKTLPIFPRLITSTALSETARAFADALGVGYTENKPLEAYPLIKCNVNPGTGERIYHLPFDQQYDKVQIKCQGEKFAKTVAEAEAMEFRRAKKWAGPKSG